MIRVRALLLLVVSGVLGACSVPNVPYPDADAVADSQLIKVGGSRFERPRGWETLDEDNIAKHAAGSVKAPDLAKSLGLTMKQFHRARESIVVYVVDTERNRQGALDVIAVADLGGSVPSDAELTSDLETSGADHVATNQVDTEAGVATTATYTRGRGTAKVYGRTIAVDLDGLVLITVAAARQATATTLAELVLTTLARE